MSAEYRWSVIGRLLWLFLALVTLAIFIFTAQAQRELHRLIPPREIHFYYLIEQPPSGLPTTGPISGILVQLTSPADHATVCTEYVTNADGVSRSACADTDIQVARINLGTDKSEFAIRSISVQVDSVTKKILAPSPGVEY